MGSDLQFQFCRLVHNREIQLHDGTRLISDAAYNDLVNNKMLTPEHLKQTGILRIHPEFRIIALGEPPGSNGVSNWLSPEILSLFVFHECRPLTKNEELHILTSKVRTHQNHSRGVIETRFQFGPASKSLKQLVDLAHVLRGNTDPTLQNLAGHLSTRQLLRIAARLEKYPNSSAYEAVESTFMAKFLPTFTRQALEKAVFKLKIVPNKTITSSARYRIDNSVLTIGNTSAPIHATEHVSKVPHVLFYDVPQHLLLMERLLQDFQLGLHLLLVGNQGVGKNKIVDRFLELLNRPREYIQLHRDTTVQTLTVQPTIKDGLLVHEDSPLVKAVKYGHVLVIDEADKAPTHVTCILKTLVESGQMVLSDGRRITNNMPPNADLDVYIKIHPDFQIIVLANRPGFPFLGNDFFGALGDLFSCHAVDNPSEESEISLLKEYGPGVDDRLIKKLVDVFGDLRTMADEGLVNYPYSTREVVNIVKHLQVSIPRSRISIS